ncbi:hypothetical protein CIG19_13885 [Enterobacterales bacterium CwR94]|nr:hypothetical protein CIG19_13885 [Enterobacterales bacterium CwR94]
MNITQREIQPGNMVTSDNQSLFYRCWPAPQTAVPKVVVLFHRGHEHSGRLEHIVNELDMPDVTFYAWDARGHGESPGPRGYSPSLQRSVQDVEEFMQHVVSVSGVPMQHIVVIAQSVGAVLAASWVHDYAPQIRALVLASPAFKVKLYVPFARAGLSLLQKFKKGGFVNSYVKGKYLTHDPERIESFNNDPLISRPIAVPVLLDLYKTAERLVADASAITVPVQMLVSGADYVVHRKPQIRFYERLRSPVKELHIMPGFYHDTLGEKDRHLALDKIRDFVAERFATPFTAFDYREEDARSPSADEWRQLAGGAEPFSVESLGYRALRVGMKAVAPYSEGVKLGFTTGFDSGSTLDYVYRNTPQGRTAIGRYIDRQYLNSIGWRGIRQRKVNLQQMIVQAVQHLQQQGMPVRIADIAAGHGRYVLDAIESVEGIDSILLRDYSELNVEKGSQLIAERQLQEMAKFVQGDAFDQASLSQLEPAPTLGIVSGLYELFPENALIRASLAGLAEAIPAGGLLIYTGQPWHPQLKTIAWSLTSHRQGLPWVMRVRSQGEMDALVNDAGFEKCAQLIDEYGIFTVSLAVRKANA